MRHFSFRSFVLGCVISIVVMVAGYKGYRHYTRPKPLPVVQTQEIKEGDSVFFTNRGKKIARLKEVRQQVALKKTFDVSAVVYTENLAKKLGLSPEYITNELTSGMESLEIRVKTTANKTECIFNTLIDNSLPLDFPEQPMLGTVTGDMGLVAITQIPPDQAMHEFEMKKSARVNYYNQNIYFATANYDPVHPVKPMGMFQPGIQFIDKDWWPGLAWFYLTKYSCGQQLVRFMENGNLTLWIKKKGGRDYRYRVHLDKEDFIKFVIPQSLIERILPVIKEAATQ